MRFSAIALIVSLLTSGCDKDSCLAVDTPIATPVGVRAIQDLRVGDNVLSFDFMKQAVVPGTVIATHSHNEATIKTLLVLRRRIGITANHPVYSARSGRFVEAGRLEAYDQVFTLRRHRGVSLEPVSRTLEPARSGPVFNITVSPHPFYFAGGILVHNKLPIRDFGPAPDISYSIEILPFSDNDIELAIDASIRVRVLLSRALEQRDGNIVVTARSSNTSLEVKPTRQSVTSPASSSDFLIERKGPTEGSDSVMFTLSTGSSRELRFR